MDANAVVMELQHKGNIPGDVQVTISQTKNPEQQKHVLHAGLKGTCTDDALKTACQIISAVKGNPRMAALSSNM